MIVRLGTLALDPATVIAPLVDRLLEMRAQARAGKDFATSDRVRDLLTEANIEIHDTPDGTTWSLNHARGF
jgi:cysteinyl-tRNA synthetase